MFARLVSIFLIAAVIACPLWCEKGRCSGGRCSSVEQSSHQPSLVCGTAHFCCAEDLSNNGHSCPCNAPTKSPCQGVCGGAVFKTSCELNDGAEPFARLLLVVKIPAPCQVRECGTHDGFHLLYCSGNQGRSLRTLHMSFVC